MRGICVALVVGWVTASAPAAEAQKPPRELLATVATGPDRALDGLRALFDVVQPGISTNLSSDAIRSMLAALVGARSLDGLDPGYSIVVFVVEANKQPAFAIAGKVRDANAVADGAGGAHVIVKNGWALIGAKKIATKLAPWALGPMLAGAAVQAPTATLYVKPMRGRIASLIREIQRQSTLVTPQTGQQMRGIMTSWIDGLTGVVADSDRIVITIEATRDRGAFDLALVPRKGTRLAKFAAAQQPGDFALLDRLASEPAQVTMVGRMVTGPYRKAFLMMMTSVFGGATNKQITDRLSAIWAASTGELAMVMRMAPMSVTQLFGIADRRAADVAVAGLGRLLGNGATFDQLGIPTTIVASAPIDHRGIAMSRYISTMDLSKVPPAMRGELQKTTPSGKTVTMLALAPGHGVVVTADASNPIDIDKLADVLLRKVTRDKPSKTVAAFLAASLARKDSMIMFAEAGAIPALQGFFGLSLGFADGATHFRVEIGSDAFASIARASAAGSPKSGP
jgi:hypothetical protein